KAWVVTKNQILYLRPAVLKEQVVIRSEVMRYNQSNLFVEMTMWNDSKSHLKALLWFTFTYVDLKTRRKATHGDELFDLLTLMKSDNNYPNTFDERVDEIRKAG